MRRLDFNQLATFVSIVEAGSLSRAAASLHKTQAAVSIQLKKLEESVGKQLLQRAHGQFHITREGEVLLAYAKKLLSLADEAYAAVADEAVSGVVRFGIPDGYARAFMQAVLKDFIARFPNIRLQIKNDTSANLLAALHEGELDLVVVTRSDTDAGGEVLTTQPIVWVAAQAFDFNPVEALPLALYQPGCQYRKRILQALNQQNLDSYIAFECQGVTGFDIALSNGLAISAVAKPLVLDEWKILDKSHGLPELGNVEIMLHASPANDTDAIHCFKNSLQQHFEMD